MKVMIGIASPRDLPEFQEAIDKIPECKLFAKYSDEYSAYYAIRKTFLEYDFTHLCIIPDDLIVTPEQFNKLKSNAEKYPVLSGTFIEPTGKALITVPNKDTTDINYEAPALEDHRIPIGLYNDIRQVFFEGFACCFMERSVVDRIRFVCEISFDHYFAGMCRMKQIPIHVDFSVVLKHLSAKMYKSGIGLYPTELKFV